MIAISAVELVGFWVGIFLTFCVLSFLYKDNPFYKFAEHLFIGVSIGYIVIRQYQDNLHPRIFGQALRWHTVVPLVLAAMMFVKFFSRRMAWLGRFPLAFIVGLVAAQNITGLVQSDIAEQVKVAARPLVLHKIDLNHAAASELTAIPGVTPVIAERLVTARAHAPFRDVDDALTRITLSETERATLDERRGVLVGTDARAGVAASQVDVFGTVSQILLLLSFLAALLYFYFSIAHTGLTGRISRFGVWVLMIGFGASFGYTVQGRIALAIGRAQDIRGVFRDPAEAAQIHGEWAALVSMALVAAGIAFWQWRSKRKTQAGASSHAL